MTVTTYAQGKVFLVDDDEDDREIFSEAFEELNLKRELILFENAKKFLDYVDKVDSIVESHLFLDLNMPKISGMELLRHLRQNLSAKKLVITIFSTSTSNRDIDTAFRAGADGYLVKPSCFGGLKDMIAKTLTRYSNYHESPSKKDFILNGN